VIDLLWYILDENGEPKPVTDLMEWARWKVANPTAHEIGYDIIGDASVSTVFLGVNHQHGDGPPLVFETMIFGGALDRHGRRYSTLKDARSGHRALCDEVRSRLH
jgi:hypothetical protein